MPTVFSHIVQKRLSQESENVGTLALEFVLTSKEAARSGMMKLLAGILPELPSRLWFRTQQTEGSSRPDMWGNDDKGKPHIFVENKFWAGLTDNQPISYLQILAKQSHPTLLLMVVPQKREQAVWGELNRRLVKAQISTTNPRISRGIVYCVTTSLGPLLALTSWNKLLSFLGDETKDDLAVSSDLLQLRALCDQEDHDAFRPFTSEQTSDQELPSLILQLTGLLQEASAHAFNEGVLHKDRLTPQADSTRIGRYAHFFAAAGWGLWLGLHFDLWNKHGRSPVWAVFAASEWGRAVEVQSLLEPWAKDKGVLVASQPNGDFAVALDLPIGEEKDEVIRQLVEQLREIGSILSILKPSAKGDSEAMAKPLQSSSTASESIVS